MMRPTFERGLGQEALALAEALVQTRTSPGILVFSGLLQLLYMNREARELCARIMQAGSGYPATGVLPPDIAALCEEMVAALRERPDPKDWEQGQVRRVAGDAQRPVLLRGVVIPSPGGPAWGCCWRRSAAARRWRRHGPRSGFSSRTGSRR